MHRRTGPGRLFLTHVVTAIAFGFVAAVVLFLVEAVIPYRGRHILLGQSLQRVLSLYALSAVSAGFLLGSLVGTLSAITRKLSKPASYTAFYAATVFFAAMWLWIVRNQGVSLGSAVLRPSVLVSLFISIILGFALKRALKKGRPSIIVPSLLTILAVALPIGLALSAEEGGIQPKAKNGRKPTGPNVVFIVLDALRADHLSSYGYERPTSPNIDQLAEEGAIFLNTHSHGNRTILAMPAVFTSLYPSYTGAISRKEIVRPLPPDRVTIAELFQEAGYQTAALMTNIHLKTVFGMTQGFDHLEEFNGGCYNLSVYWVLEKLGLVERPLYTLAGSPSGDRVTDNALEWLDELRADPFFLYVHYMDTHHPYTPPKEFQDLFVESENPTEAGALFGETVKLLNANQQASLSPTELKTLMDYYDATIRYSDFQIGRILDVVRDISKTRETLVVITSDHGDEFLEHGGLYHNNLLIEELLHVPLIFWDPARYNSGQQFEHYVQHVDILPTLVDVIGGIVPDAARGTSLDGLMSGRTSTWPDSTRISFAEGDFCTAIIADNWKVTYVDSTGSSHLYDLAADPRETTNVSDKHPEKYAKLYKLLDAYLEAAADERMRMFETQLDPETMEQLKKLGYI